MRVLMLDPSLFTLPYDRALCHGLAAAGCGVSLVGRPLRPAERGSPANHDLPLVAHFYRCSESRLVQASRLGRLAKSVEHLVDMARLPGLCGRLRPDVIHVQWLPLPALDRHFLGGLRRLAPLVMTVHNSVPFHGAAGSRLQLMAADGHYDAFDALIAHTPTTRHHLVGRGADPARITIVPHGVLPMAPATAPAATPDVARCRVLFFGEIKPYKGLELLLEAIAALPAGPRDRVSLHVAGRPRMDMAPLQALAEARGIAAQVTWDLRFIADHEIGGVFAGADVVALPYHDVDSSGVLSLAIGAGKAVLASAIGGFRDLLADGDTALLARLEPAAFAQALARLIEEPPLRRRLGETLRQLGLGAIPSWPAIGRDTAAVYARAIAAWRAAANAPAAAPTPRRA
jgi:glycosyltransferase involved in cell wall biosynthesis